MSHRNRPRKRSLFFLAGRSWHCDFQAFVGRIGVALQVSALRLPLVHFQQAVEVSQLAGPADAMANYHVARGSFVGGALHVLPKPD